MKKTINWGWALILGVALAVPTVARAQGQDEGTAYANFYAESDCAKKAPMGEKFINDYKTSEYVEGTFLMTVDCYVKLNNTQKILELANKVEQLAPKAKPANKARVYAQAMEAARNANNIQQVIGFGDKVLAIDPNDLNTLLTLSSTIAFGMQNDKAANDKAIAYGQKGLEVLAKMDAKSVGLSDADWAKQKNAIEGNLHAAVGTAYFNKQDFDKAVDELAAATKDTPTDNTSWYLLGLAYNQQYAAQVKPYTEAVTKTNEAIKKRADQALIDEGKATTDALEQSLREKRDQAIDALATAVAIGGTTKDPAMEQLKKLYSEKNKGSTDGLDQLINSKKPVK